MKQAGVQMSVSSGEKLRAKILAVYELDAGELVLLDQAMQLCDVLARVNKEVSDLTELTTTGSAGQTVEHPLMAAQRSFSLTLAKLVEALKLPVPGAADDEAGESRVTLQARRAARARWDKERGKHG